MRIAPLTAVFLAALALAACERESPEKRAARQVTARTRCVAEELALQAKERLATLDTVLANARGTPMEQMAASTYSFAFALRQHADAAARSAALMDSAMAVRSAEDSTRLANAAMQARPGAAAPGSVEANVAARYTREISAALGNPNHPCNKTEEEE
jgi:hypothetical protein